MLKLFSFADKYKEKKEIADLLKISKWIEIIWTFLYFAQYILLEVLVLNMDSTSGPRQGIIISIITISVVSALLLNGGVYHPKQILQYKYLNNFRSVIQGYLTDEGNKALEGLIANYGPCIFSYSSIISLIASTGFALSTLCFMSRKFPLTPQLFWASVLLIAILAVTSKIFYKNMKIIIEKLQNSHTPAFKSTLIRTTIPVLPNLTESIAIPILSIGIGGQLAPILIVLAKVLSEAWYLTQQGTSILLTKKFLTSLNRELEAVSEKYIINNAGYKTQTKNCRPRRETLKKSKELKGMVLNNFIPMKITNLKEITHTFTYSFAPGLYQIQGLNGIGKTTLLQTLALPEGFPVEYAKGEAALNGKPFYNEEESIEEHRDRVFYINAKSPQKNPNDLERKDRKEYPTINQVIEATIKREHKVQSEGEAGLINICYALQKIRNGNKDSYLLCIDEILSRMYNDNRYPLRDETKILLSEATKSGKCTILIVDHMTLHEEAIQLKMSTKAISLI